MNENTKEQGTESRPEDAQASEQVKAVVRRLPIVKSCVQEQYDFRGMQMPEKIMVHKSNDTNSSDVIGFAENIESRDDIITADLHITDKHIIDKIMNNKITTGICGYIAEKEGNTIKKINIEYINISLEKS